MQSLSQPIQQLFSRLRGYETRENIAEDDSIAIGGHQTTNAVASLYENVRYLVDYQEQHSIRRSAIERILRRRILIERNSVNAAALLGELVEGGYLAREQATRGLARQVDTSITKFFRILPLLDGPGPARRAILSFVASEIECALAPHEREIDEVTVQAFYKTVQQRIHGAEFEKEYLDVQTRCACRRALLGSDDATLSYALWLLYVPQWQKNLDGDISELVTRIPAIDATIRRHVRSPIQWHIVQKLSKECVYFRIIRGLIQRDGSKIVEVFEDDKKMESATEAFLNEKYTFENAKALSSGMRAVSYLLLTKVALALAVEFPYEFYILKEVKILPLFINILFHPILLFGLALEVVSRDPANTEAVVNGLKKVLYSQDTEPIVVYRRIRFAKTFTLLYLVFAIGVFGAILGVLQALAFNSLGILIFFVFFVFVSYFAFRIRYNASRWKVLSDGTFATMANLVAIPIVHAGYWLSRKFSTVNVFVFILDFIIETPFKRMLSFSNQFVLYLKDRAAEVY